MRRRRSGRTFEGALLLMAVMAVAACVLPPLVRPDGSAPPEAACLAALAGQAVGVVGSDATCPLTGARSRADRRDDGVTALSCPGPHDRPVPALVRTAGAWRVDQDLGAGDLVPGTTVDTGAWLTTTVVREAQPDLVFATRPAAWLRWSGASALALLSLALAALFVTEQHTGWRPGGTPPPPGRARFAAQVLAVALLNPLGWAAIGLLTLESRVELGPGRVTARAPLGSPVVLDDVLGVALLARDEDAARVVIVHRPAPDAPPACAGVLTLARGEVAALGAIGVALAR